MNDHSDKSKHWHDSLKYSFISDMTKEKLLRFAFEEGFEAGVKHQLSISELYRRNHVEKDQAFTKSKKTSRYVPENCNPNSSKN